MQYVKTLIVGASDVRKYLNDKKFIRKQFLIDPINMLDA